MRSSFSILCLVSCGLASLACKTSPEKRALETLEPLPVPGYEKLLQILSATDGDDAALPELPDHQPGGDRALENSPPPATRPERQQNKAELEALENLEPLPVL